MYMDLAKALLEKEYLENKAKALDGSYQRLFIEEKMRHSYQVLGAGKYLVRHEAFFQSFSEEEKERFLATVLLHDVARFCELILRSDGVNIDHGVYGAQMLEKEEYFNDRARVLLPIRHHGHLIEMLYEDAEYLALSQEERRLAREVSFLVRDADKLANFYLLAKKFKEMEDIFFVRGNFEEPMCKILSPMVIESFFAHQSIHSKEVRNFADKALFFLAWIYDLNYQASFQFIKKLGIAEQLVQYFAKFWRTEDAQRVYAEICSFISGKAGEGR